MSDAEARELLHSVLARALPLAQEHGMISLLNVFRNFLREQCEALGPVPARPNLFGGLVRVGRMEVLCSLADLLRFVDVKDLVKLNPIPLEGGPPGAQASPYDA